MTRSLDAFPDDFWCIEDWPLLHSRGKPTSVQQALVEMNYDSWDKMVDALFEGYSDIFDITVDDVLFLIRETNTCEGLDTELDVWIDEAGDFKIKVYYV